jgi:ABC-type dipeptide/oligopeptide/nickel transport system ATPase component
MPVMNNGDQIAEALIANKNMNESEARKRTIKLLREVNIPEPEKIARQFPHQLSGGMAQRVMIAMMLPGCFHSGSGIEFTQRFNQ